MSFMDQIKTWLIARLKEAAKSLLMLAAYVAWLFVSFQAAQWGMSKPPALGKWDQWFVIAVFLHPVLVFWIARQIRSSRPLTTIHHRGASMTDAGRAKKEVASMSASGDPCFLWGEASVPLKFAAEHMLIAGSVGSGKTTLVRRLMRSVIGPRQIREQSRSLILDGAGDLLETIYGLAGDQAIVNLDPFDLRSRAWDIAADVKTLAHITAVAEILFPRDEHTNSPFFSEAVQALAVAAIDSLNQTQGDAWTFSDLIHSLDNLDELEGLLSQTSSGKAALSKYFRPGTTSDNIVATLDTKIRPYRTVAALWDHADHRYSVKDWIGGHDILYLKHSHEAPEAVRPINRAFIFRAIQALLSGPDRKPESWFFLDEFASLGKIESLPNLLTLGRKKGACVLLTLQNFSVVKQAYEEDEAKAMLGVCGTKALLRFEDETTATWAAECFGGKRQVLQIFRDPSTAPTPDGHTYRHASAEEMLVLPSEFVHLPKLSSGTLAGYFVIPGKAGALRFKDQISSRALFPIDGAPSEFSGASFARPTDHQIPKTRQSPHTEATAEESHDFAEDLKKFRNQGPEP